MTFVEKWPAEKTETLTKLWLDGLSCAMIAAALGDGLSRNAVIGKVHRLKLPKRRTQVQVARSKPVMKPRTPRPPKRTRSAFKAGPEMQPEPYVFQVSVWEPLPGSEPVPMEHMTGCKWCVTDPFAPVGTLDLFCNLPVVEGKSWCVEHSNRAAGKGTPSERSAIKSARSIDYYERMAA